MRFLSIVLVVGSLLPIAFAYVQSEQVFVHIPSAPFGFGNRIYIEGQNGNDVNVTITDLNTGDSVTTKTNEAGDYIVDLSTFPKGYSINHSIEIQVCRSVNDCRKFTYIIDSKDLKNGYVIFALNITDWEQAKATQTVSVSLLEAWFDKRLTEERNEAIRRSTEERNENIKWGFITNILVAAFFFWVGNRLEKINKRNKLSLALTSLQPSS